MNYMNDKFVNINIYSVRKAKGSVFLFWYVPKYEIVYDDTTVIYTAGSFELAVDVRNAMNMAYNVGRIDGIGRKV